MSRSQHTGGVADAAAIERHVHYLPFDLRHPASVVIPQGKDPPRAIPLITPIALFAIGPPPTPPHFFPPPPRTLYCDNRHNPSSSQRLTTEPFSSLSTLLMHYPQRLGSIFAEERMDAIPTAE